MQKAWPAVAATVAMCMASSLAIPQDAKIDLGVLTCSMAEAREAPATAAPSADSQFREVQCSFKPKKGVEETYEGKVRGINVSMDKKTTVLWLVRGAPGMPIDVGFLEQTYSADSAGPKDQAAPPLVGEPNSNIVLSSMEEREEGSAASPEKPRPTGFVIMALELKLKSTSG